MLAGIFLPEELQPSPNHALHPGGEGTARSSRLSAPSHLGWILSLLVYVVFGRYMWGTKVEVHIRICSRNMVGLDG